MATSLKIDSALSAKVDHLAQIKQRTAHWIMCEAIRVYVEKEEAREAHRQEALDSWEHYRETGLHVTGEELKSWLSTWGSENELDAPECHE